MKKAPATREARLAAALRENLKRRKARSRALAEAEPDRAPGTAEASPSRREAATKRD